MIQTSYSTSVVISMTAMKYECHFTTVERIRYLLQAFHQIFGWDSEQSSRHLPYGLGIVEEHLYWREYKLDVALAGKENGPLIAHTVTSSKTTLRMLRLIRNKYEVNPGKVFREAHIRRVQKKYLDELDGKIRFGIAVMVLLSTFWLVIGLPNEIRLELLLVSSMIALIFEYSKMIASVDIRLMLWGAFWYFAYVAVPAGIVYGLGIAISMLYSYSFSPFESPNIVISMLATSVMMIAYFIAILRGRRARGKVNGQQGYLASKRLPAVLSIGLQFVRFESQSILMFLALLSGLSFGVRALWTLQELYFMVGFCIIIVFLPFFLFSTHRLHRCLTGEIFRSQLLAMARNLPDFTEIVNEIAEQEKRRKRHNA